MFSNLMLKFWTLACCAMCDDSIRFHLCICSVGGKNEKEKIKNQHEKERRGFPRRIRRPRVGFAFRWSFRKGRKQVSKAKPQPEPNQPSRYGARAGGQQNHNQYLTFGQQQVTFYLGMTLLFQDLSGRTVFSVLPACVEFGGKSVTLRVSRMFVVFSLGCCVLVGFNSVLSAFVVVIVLKLLLLNVYLSFDVA